ELHCPLKALFAEDHVPYHYGGGTTSRTRRHNPHRRGAAISLSGVFASAIHDSNRVYATASTTGPRKMPTRPKAIRPPITPASSRSNGRWAPLRISNGRMTLSVVLSSTLQITRTVPQTDSPLQYSQTTAGTSTGKGPSCARQSMNITAVSTAANGTPARAKPRPPSSDCPPALTTTPRANLRI